MQSFTLNPNHAAGQFCRTLRVAGREPRFVQFTPTTTVELNRAEIEYLAGEIGRHIIGQVGVPFPKPEKQEPAKLSIHDDPVDENGDVIDESSIELSGWQRCLRDMARAAERITTIPFRRN